MLETDSVQTVVAALEQRLLESDSRSNYMVVVTPLSSGNNYNNVNRSASASGQTSSESQDAQLWPDSGQGHLHGRGV